MTAERTLVTCEVADGVAVLTLQNEPANAYSYAMMRQLDGWILEARMDPDVHVIVLTGSGERFFCAGADIAMLQSMSADTKYAFCLHANETLRRLEETPKLVVAALNGHTVGGGLEVALACDLRVARAGGARFGLPEVKLGVLPGTGGTQRLTRLWGKARAIEWMATGASCTAAEALELGLISRVIEAADRADFLHQVLTWTRQFCPPHAASGAIGLMKRACQTGAETSLDVGLALERELQQRLFTAGDAAEGLGAYADKRTPSFRGR
ncbi:MAG: enoyl-CoA hydratase/isomerase family protein [Deltaproteobacteria bacterium]|nr:enoyl-CoA hydratase/isomerase family protein [Deltaproteobacteria bacterium]